MGPDEQQSWKDEALEFVLQAVAADEVLRSLLVFKGARILYRRLGTAGRMSLDLDATLRKDGGIDALSPEAVASHLRAGFERAVDGAIRRSEPVVYGLNQVTVTPDPRNGHPFGWQGYLVRIGLGDRRRVSGLGVPILEVEIAASEDLGGRAVEALPIGGGFVLAYTAARQTAEKLRAFLQSSGDWRSKVGSQPRALRVRDLVDLLAVVKRHPIEEAAFWDAVAREFRIACAARAVDCQGWATYADLEDAARIGFRAEVGLHGNAGFEVCWSGLRLIVAALEAREIFPLRNPLRVDRRGTDHIA